MSTTAFSYFLYECVSDVCALVELRGPERCAAFGPPWS